MTSPHDHGGPAVPGALLDMVALQTQFGDSPDGKPISALSGGQQPILDEQLRIVEHQWRNRVRRGLVRGFLLAGPPGAGKTVLAKRLGYELALRFPRVAGQGGVAVVLLDGSEIARARYGDSERRIRDIFAAAQDGMGVTGRHTVLIFDDVESVLMARGSTHAKEWHFSQDSVFFHALDELDSARAVVVATTNRGDLVDEALRDRLLEYELDHPAPHELVEAGVGRLRGQGLAAGCDDALRERLRTAIAEFGARSFRDAEHLALREYVAQLTATGPRAPRASAAGARPSSATGSWRTE